MNHTTIRPLELFAHAAQLTDGTWQPTITGPSVGLFAFPPRPTEAEALRCAEQLIESARRIRGNMGRETSRVANFCGIRPGIRARRMEKVR